MPQTNRIDQGSVETVDSVGHPTSSISDVGKDLAAMNARIDDIVAFQKRKDPWFRDTSFIISSAAFFISLLTSGISAYRTYRQDINSRKDALQATIQQYYATSLANVASQFSFQKDLNGPTDPKYASSQYFAGGANTIVQNANVAFAKQALSLVNELGRNASAVDLGETAVILGTVNQFSVGGELYQRAIDTAVNSVEYLGAIRGLAAQQYYLGSKDESAVNMKKALDVFSKFPSEANGGVPKLYRRTDVSILGGICEGDRLQVIERKYLSRCTLRRIIKSTCPSGLRYGCADYSCKDCCWKLRWLSHELLQAEPEAPRHTMGS
jgi:hypothetical protein